MHYHSSKSVKIVVLEVRKQQNVNLSLIISVILKAKISACFRFFIYLFFWHSCVTEEWTKAQYDTITCGRGNRIRLLYKLPNHMEQLIPETTTQTRSYRSFTPQFPVLDYYIFLFFSLDFFGLSLRYRL